MKSLLQFGVSREALFFGLFISWIHHLTTVISDLFCPHTMVEGMLTGPEKHVCVLRVLPALVHRH